MGIGMVLAVDRERVGEAIAIAGGGAFPIGVVEAPVGVRIG
jgi:hypothetical protein